MKVAEFTDTYLYHTTVIVVSLVHAGQYTKFGDYITEYDITLCTLREKDECINFIKNFVKDTFGYNYNHKSHWENNIINPEIHLQGYYTLEQIEEEETDSGIPFKKFKYTICKPYTG